MQLEDLAGSVTSRLLLCHDSCVVMWLTDLEFSASCGQFGASQGASGVVSHCYCY
jgi:hypothetical protein